MVPARRRQYGTGSLYQRASDGRWLGVIQIGWNARGGRRTVTVSAATKTEAKKKLEAQRRKIDSGHAPVEGVRSRSTVKAWAATWLEVKVAKVRPTTWTVYRSAVNAWIVPTLGNKRLADLTPGDIRSLANAVRGGNENTSTHARSVQRIFQRILKDAIAEGHNVPERLLLIDAPTAAVSDRTAIPADDAIKLLQRASTLRDGSRWAAALLQGMRQSECLGLTWSCVDLEGGTIDVSWQLQSLPWTHGCDETPVCGRRLARGCPDRLHRVPDGHDAIHLEGAWHLTRPKTSRGRRVIPLVPWMTEALNTWSEATTKSPHDLVWHRGNGRPQDKKLDNSAWYALQTAANTRHPGGRMWTMHEARHTTATLLLEAGIDPQTVKAILGHSDIATSRNYQHVSEALARQAMDAVAERLGLP